MSDFGGHGTVSDSQETRVLPVNMSNLELDRLFASCMPRLQRTARQLLRNTEDSEDALQDGLLLAFKNLHQFQGRSRFTTWLHTIVRNAALTHVRRMKSRPPCSSEELSAGDESTIERFIADPRPGPDEECVLSERSRILDQVMQELPSTYRSIMRLCDIDGLDSKDAAQSLGITTSAVKAGLFRARRLVTQRIRQMCVPQYVGFSDHDISRIQRTRVSEFGEQVRSVDLARSQTEQYRTRARAHTHKRGGPVGGNYESTRERSRLWKSGAVPLVCSAACNGHHSTS